MSRRLLLFTRHVGKSQKIPATITRTMALFPPKKKDDEESPGVKTKELVRIREFFNEKILESDRNSKQFLETVEDFNNLKKLKRFGYSEFIHAALPAMKEFGVEKDLEAYKALMRVFPPGAFIPASKFTSGFYPHYVQQETAIRILIQMEENRVMPDKEMESIIIDAFSKFSLVWQRCARMTYWMTKFKNANPFPFPEQIPTDPLELAIVALKRMTFYVDPQTEIYVYRTSQIDETTDDDTWICFAQSDSQCRLIEELDFDQYRVSIDGPYNVWVKENSISYFVLYARKLRPKENRDLVEEFLRADQANDDVSDIPISNFGNVSLTDAIDPMRHKHEQDDGTILAVVATGTSCQNSLVAWLRKLEQHNPRLKQISVVISSISDSKSSTNFSKEFDHQLHNHQKPDTEPPNSNNKP